MAANKKGAVDKAQEQTAVDLDHSKLYNIEALEGAKHLEAGKVYEGVPGGDAEGIISKGHAKLVD